MKARLVSGDSGSITMSEMDIGTFAKLSNDPDCVIYKLGFDRTVIVCESHLHPALPGCEVDGWSRLSINHFGVIPLKPGDMIEIV